MSTKSVTNVSIYLYGRVPDGRVFSCSGGFYADAAGEAAAAKQLAKWRSESSTIYWAERQTVTTKTLVERLDL